MNEAAGRPRGCKRGRADIQGRRRGRRRRTTDLEAGGGRGRLGPGTGRGGSRLRGGGTDVVGRRRRNALTGVAARDGHGEPWMDDGPADECHKGEGGRWGSGGAAAANEVAGTARTSLENVAVDKVGVGEAAVPAAVEEAARGPRRSLPPWSRLGARGGRAGDATVDEVMGRPRRLSPPLTPSRKSAAGDVAADADAGTADRDVAADAAARAGEEGAEGCRLLTPTRGTTAGDVAADADAQKTEGDFAADAVVRAREGDSGAGDSREGHRPCRRDGADDSGDVAGCGSGPPSAACLPLCRIYHGGFVEVPPSRCPMDAGGSLGRVGSGG